MKTLLARFLQHKGTVRDEKREILECHLLYNVKMKAMKHTGFPSSEEVDKESGFQDYCYLYHCKMHRSYHEK